MPDVDKLGWIAAGLTLLTCSMRSMVALRKATAAASLCFIAYDALGALCPVLTLHLLLRPCNLFRRSQLCRGQSRRPPASGTEISVPLACAHCGWTGRD